MSRWLRQACVLLLAACGSKGTAPAADADAAADAAPVAVADAAPDAAPPDAAALPVHDLPALPQRP